MILLRHKFTANGVFGELLNEMGTHLCVTLEHAYPNGDSWIAKIPDEGTFKCVRGLHQISGYSLPFESFEITGVPNHFGILFHVGNYNSDSEGCVLLGREILNSTMITDSLTTFTQFMKSLEGCDSFELNVTY